MKVAVDVRLWSSSGIGTYLRNVLPGIIRAMPEAQFVLLGDGREQNDAAELRRPGVEARKVGARVYSIAEQVTLAAKIPRDADVVWAPHYNIPLCSPGKLLVTVHDVYPIAMARNHGVRRDKYLYTSHLLRKLPSRASCIISVSRFTAREIGRWLGPMKCPVHVIHNGVSFDWFRVQRGERPHPRPYLLYVGNVKPHKNIRRMLQAFAAATSAGLERDLVIVGRLDGFSERGPSVKDVCRGLGDRLRFTGTVSDDALKQYVLHADALILVSLYEGFGIPPLEAMACGTPTVVSDMGALAETAGPAAVTCNPYDVQEIARCMSRVCLDDGLRQDLRDQGRLHARRFSWTDCADQTAKLILKLCR